MCFITLDFFLLFPPFPFLFLKSSFHFFPVFQLGQNRVKWPEYISLENADAECCIVLTDPQMVFRCLPRKKISTGNIDYLRNIKI